MNDNILINNLYSIDLLEELNTYGMNLKAKILYKKCLMAGKNDLAEKINKKYNLYKEQDDMITAFIFMMSSINKN